MATLSYKNRFKIVLQKQAEEIKRLNFILVDNSKKLK